MLAYSYTRQIRKMACVTDKIGKYGSSLLYSNSSFHHTILHGQLNDSLFVTLHPSFMLDTIKILLIEFLLIVPHSRQRKRRTCHFVDPTQRMFVFLKIFHGLLNM